MFPLTHWHAAGLGGCLQGLQPFIHWKHPEVHITEASTALLALPNQALHDDPVQRGNAGQKAGAAVPLVWVSHKDRFTEVSVCEWVGACVSV